MKDTINKHNMSILNKRKGDKVKKNCNCRQPDNCRVYGECLSKSVIYQATVITDDNKPNQTYIGLTANTFKVRYSNHKSSFCNPHKRTSTELNKYIWTFKDNETNYTIKWKILKKAMSYKKTTNKCNVCGRNTL